MTERFLRARTRLTQHEQTLLQERTQSRLMGRPLPDENVTTPKIGEWDLTMPSVATDAAKEVTVTTNNNDTLNEERKLLKSSKKKIEKPKPLFKFHPPPAQRTSSPNRRSTGPRVAYPQGTSTTNLESIIQSKFRQPNKPLPPLKDEENEENESNVNFLPLETFDDETYEQYSLDYLLQHPKAWSRYQIDVESGTGKIEWRECNVIGYDPKTSLFTIEWDDDKKQKQVARFNLKFDIEDNDLFNARIEAAKRASRDYEMQFRLNCRVESIPTDDLPELSNENMNRIIQMSQVPEQECAVLIEPLKEEIKGNFRIMNNRFDYVYEILHNPHVPNREDFIKLMPEPRLVPYYGLAVHGPPNFVQIFRRFSQTYLKANENVLRGLQIIWSIFMDSESMLFLTDGKEELLELEEYVKYQHDGLSRTTKLFKGSIQETLEGAISSTVHDESSNSVGPNEKIKYQKMVILTTRMLHTVLLNIVDRTLTQYSSLFLRYTSPDPPLKPQFLVSLTFSRETNQLALIPTTYQFKTQILQMLYELESSVHDLPSISLPLFDINPAVVSFLDCIQRINQARNELSETLDTLIEHLNKFLDSYRHLEPSLSLEPQSYIEEFDPKGTRSLSDYRNELNKFQKVLEVVSNDMTQDYKISIFQISCKQFKEEMSLHTNELIMALLNQMKHFAVCNLQELRDEFDQITDRMKASPETPKELASLKQFMTKVKNTTKDREAKMNSAMQRFSFLEEFKFEISNDECQNKYQILQKPHRLDLMIEETERMLQVEKIRMIRELRVNQRTLETDTLSVTELLPVFISKYQDLEMTVDAVDEINEIQKKLIELKSKQDTYTQHEKLFDADPTSCKILTKLIEEFNPLHMLWNLAGDWFTMNTTWLDTPFPQVKPDAMTSFMIQTGKKIAKLKKDLAPHKALLEKVLTPLADQIDKFKQNIPLISKLRHPGIKTKHWEKISEIVGFSVIPSMELTLQGFLDFDLGRWNEQITEICSVAAQEYNIESSLDQMDAELQTKQFVTHEFRNTGSFILFDVDDIISLIDDQLVTTQTLLTSPFIAPVKKRALERLSFLRNAHETLDQWVECQRGWLYLQPIFTGTSIQQKLFKEARDWNNVDKTWQSIMTLTHNHPDFTNVMHRDNLLQDLKYSNELLESITQGLNQYLEAKRHGFPRFFFLSNDELIAILSHTKDFNQIQKSMNKLFEYVATITVDDDMMITHMNDAGLESVKFITPVDGDTPEIEDWLNAFEDEMKATLKDNISSSLQDAAKRKREQWLSMYPAQVILIANQILWTTSTTQVLRSNKLRGMKLLQAKYIEQLEQLTSMVRQPLKPALRQVISCMLINEVHNRDIIQNLIKQEVVDLDNFKWNQQLRYYWEEETVIVRSINNVYEYSYEYAGNSARLVITPLTDRCYQTLLSAFKQFLSGAPSGPAGTGKTETVRDCAKALGRSCVVYNCSEEVTPEQMSQFFAGLSTSGSWSCFDEFNRINIEVLSVIAQQVRTIQNAIASSADTFVLDERTLKLNSNAAICITMNPGYAGRTELPDNLKASFRPCAMMVPDFIFISEILLFSGGYAEAPTLSVKLVALFDLCRTQLSNTHHYDWGMRAMKSILTTAGKEKRVNLDKPESKLLVDCIRDCTKPRLISVDIPLFENIIHDVFPDVKSDKAPNEMEENLKVAFNTLGCVPLQIYLNKAIELFDTSLLRHGLMLVGGPMGGKSTCWKALEIARKAIADAGNGMAIHIESLNPKSISIPELYGLFDPVTSGWSDGVLSSKIRDCSVSEPTEYKWIIVDGPVDSLWIESMNSLLDDNKVLCLSNNERISLGGHVRLVFEVDDLSQASPATVSRCGMVFFDPSTLPWEVIADSYINTIKHEGLKVLLKKMFDTYCPSLIQFIEFDAKTAMGSNPRFLLNSLIKILSCFMDLMREPVIMKENEADDPKEVDPLNYELFFSPFNQHEMKRISYMQENVEIFEMIFVFAAVWSFGAVLAEESKTFFDNFFRELCEKNGLSKTFPTKSTVYDYYINFVTSSWENWIDKPENGLNLTKDKSLELQLVPTNESAAMMYISRLLVHHSYHLLFHGPETAKTLVLRTLMDNVLDDKFECRNLPMANCSTSANVLKVFMSFMQKRHGAYGPFPNHKLIVFLDNIGTVRPEIYGAQPPLELFRQFLDYGGWYDTSKIIFQHAVDTILIASMGIPGGGLFDIPQRLLRHFYFMHIPKYKSETLSQIISNLLELQLTEYVQGVKNQIGATTKASISIYEKCSKQLLPIPGKSHYIFSLRNIIRVIKGMMLCQKEDIKDGHYFIRLWYHEMMREFHDRFNSEEDRNWFVETINSSLDENFGIKFEDLSKEGTMIFNDFSDGGPNYHESNLPTEQILDLCRDVLEDHNRESSKPLDIVLFKEAVTHINFISRILPMERGHVMLVGIKSSGRKSLARLALHMASMEIFEIKITRTYGFAEWREDMKTLMKQCGISDLPTGFMINDVQIIGTFQLEDISNLLINAEIPNLFERDEIEQIKADLVQNELLTDEDPWDLFQGRIRQHLHLILVFSPYGSAFKENILSFTALRTETSMDWYMPWSRNALESVASASLSKGNLGNSSLTKPIVDVCVNIHKSVEDESVKFLNEQKRFTACTPSRYFELLSTFISRLKEKQQTTTTTIKNYVSGVEKIKTTRTQIEQLSQQLDRDIPMLKEKQEQVEEMILDLREKKSEVEETRSEVKKQSEIAEVEAAAAKETNRIAQEKLAAAQPILIAAQEAVDSMDRDSLVNIKTLKKIHPALRETFDAICIIFGRLPRRVDGDQPGVKVDDYWPETLSLLNDIQFIKKVKMFEVEKMPKETITKLKKYVGANKAERDAKLAAVQSGYQAVANLYQWVCASYDYWFVYQEILPRKIEAEQAAENKAKAEKVLASRKKHLQQVEDQLSALQNRVDEEKTNEQNLADSVANTKLRLQRAQKIMQGLSGETKRWTETANQLNQSSQFILGDTILVAASMVHLGSFAPSYRTDLLEKWKKFLSEAQIKYSESFTIASNLGTDAVIRDWIVKGLPNDTHSIENALIIESSKQSYPLLIDPQLSGTKWLRAILGESLVVLRFDQSDFIQRLKSCITFGLPVLIENIGLKLDPLIEPILNKEFMITDGQKQIALGGEYVNFSDNFRMYLSTKYPNPHYSPEVCSQVSLINFTTTQVGLSDLLMNNLIEVEQQELDKERISIMEANAENFKRLKEVEKDILDIVSNAGSDILDDDNAIETLTKAQKTSANIEQQMKASAQTEKLITEFRNTFISVAERAALLYFCAADFAVVDPMYQFSLKWFVSLFKTAISKAEHCDDTEKLISSFHNSIAKQFYQSVSFSLFSRHKLLFSTLLATRILVSQHKISSSELAFLLSPTPEKAEKTIEWIPDDVWPLIISIQSVSPSFSTLLKNIQENEEKWKEYYESTEPETMELPFDQELTPFQKLIILRIFHLHRVREGLRMFVGEMLGQEFVTPPSLNLTNVFKESSPISPLIFIITPGIDPVDEVMEVATSMELDRYLKFYSLGRGRGQGAEELILDAAERGFWVMLQNCHLSLSWMPRLEYLLDNMDPKKVHERFRLCLVTMSDDRFPIGILYQGSKLIYEIPKGIRENMLRSYSGYNADEYEAELSETEKQLIFHLSFFHSVVLERLQFGSIGWNIPYEFNPSDFAISRRHLKQFLNEAGLGDVPFEALSYVIGELNYGGRVTDPWDRRLLLSLLHRYFSAEINKNDFTFGPRYETPSFTVPLKDLEEIINTWPIITEGQDVGLSMNASTITARNDALSIFNSLIEIQPTLVAASGEISEEQFALNLVQKLINDIPEQFNIHNFTKSFDLEDTINTVLHHEILLYNKLLSVIKESLLTLEKGLKGFIVFDEKLELLNRRLLANKIPELWLKYSFPSILSLHSYIEDIKQRISFMDSWVRTGKPNVFKLGAFYHPEEFATAVLQVYARKNSVPFDSLKWTSKMVEGEITSSPEEGIYVEGLFIEGAKWSKEEKTLVECGQRELISVLPTIHLIPQVNNPDQPVSRAALRNVYTCPLYRTQNRGTGALDLPNYIMSLYIPTISETPDHWIQRSVAVFISVQL